MESELELLRQEVVLQLRRYWEVVEGLPDPRGRMRIHRS